MIAFAVNHPLASTAAASLTGLGIAWWILRWEIRFQRRQRRYGGFIIGGGQ